MEAHLVDHLRNSLLSELNIRVAGHPATSKTVIRRKRPLSAQQPAQRECISPASPPLRTPPRPSSAGGRIRPRSSEKKLEPPRARPVDVMLAIVESEWGRVDINPEDFDSSVSAICQLPVSPFVSVALRKGGWREFFRTLDVPVGGKHRVTQSSGSKLPPTSGAENSLGGRRSRLRRAITRMCVLCAELKVPAADRNFIMARLSPSFDASKGVEFEMPIDDLDAAERCVGVQTALLLEHRTKTTAVLRAISIREELLEAALKAFDRGRKRRGSVDTAGEREDLTSGDAKDGTLPPLAALAAILCTLRGVSLAVVDAITAWRSGLWQPLPFLWRGANYLLKMSEDLCYLAGDSGQHMLAEAGLSLKDMTLLIPGASSRPSLENTPPTLQALNIRRTYWGVGSDTAATDVALIAAEQTILSEEALQKKISKDNQMRLKEFHFIPLLRWLPEGASPPRARAVYRGNSSAVNGSREAYGRPGSLSPLTDRATRQQPLSQLETSGTSPEIYPYFNTGNALAPILSAVGSTDEGKSLAETGTDSSKGLQRPDEIELEGAGVEVDNTHVELDHHYSTVFEESDDNRSVGVVELKEEYPVLISIEPDTQIDENPQVADNAEALVDQLQEDVDAVGQEEKLIEEGDVSSLLALLKPASEQSDVDIVDGKDLDPLLVNEDSVKQQPNEEVAASSSASISDHPVITIVDDAIPAEATSTKAPHEHVNIEHVSESVSTPTGMESDSTRLQPGEEVASPFPLDSGLPAPSAVEPAEQLIISVDGVGDGLETDPVHSARTADVPPVESIVESITVSHSESYAPSFVSENVDSREKSDLDSRSLEVEPNQAVSVEADTEFQVGTSVLSDEYAASFISETPSVSSEKESAKAPSVVEVQETAGQPQLSNASLAADEYDKDFDLDIELGSSSDDG